MTTSRSIRRSPQPAAVLRCAPGSTASSVAATLDRLLARLHANKAELLGVLERPEIPLHTNGSENDIRAHVTRRKVSAGTRSDLGRDCRDAFLGLAKTCTQLGIPGQCLVPPLPDLIRCRGQPT